RCRFPALVPRPVPSLRPPAVRLNLCAGCIQIRIQLGGKMSLFVRKDLGALLAEAGAGTLRRELGPLNLVTLGIGAVIGAGIFVLSGEVASLHAGPALTLSIVLAGVACVFAGLCYAELASMIPVAGSAYTYAYATLGELVAWIIGWDLILEYSLSSSTVAVGWS